MQLNCRQIEQAINPVAKAGPQDATFWLVSTDTRTIAPGALFVALVGPRFDGRSFLNEAFTKGALGAVISGPIIGQADHPIFSVQDTLVALGNLGSSVRNQYKLPVIAITGSNGKTTTKELAKRILQTRHTVLASDKNFNNLIGVPQTLFLLDDYYTAVVLEMGMNHEGEIRRLTEIASPTIRLITNISAAHIGPLGTIEAIARAKGELWENDTSSTMLIVNRDDPRVVALAGSRPGTKIHFSIESRDAEVSCRELALLGWEGSRFLLLIDGQSAIVHLRIPGVGNVSNALAAASVGHALGIPIEEIAAALSGSDPVDGRSQRITLAGGIELMNDSYNANPESMRHAIELLGALPCADHKVAILGDMRELGAYAEEAHQALGKQIARSGITNLFVFGEYANQVVDAAIAAGFPHRRATVIDQPEAVVDQVQQFIQAGDRILVKASRGVALDRVVQEFRKRSEGE